MIHLQEFIKKQIFEAPANIYKKVIGGIIVFNKETTNEEIIDTIINDFCIKCVSIIKDSYAPNCSLNSLCTYELFNNRYAIDNPGDVTASKDAEEIYSEIPSEKCSEIILKKLKETEGYEVLSIEEIKSMFGGGEFPLIKIWKGYHEGTDKINVTYIITR